MENEYFVNPRSDVSINRKWRINNNNNNNNSLYFIHRYNTQMNNNLTIDKDHKCLKLAGLTKHPSSKERQ